jgi:hypothetical protein
LHVGRARKPFRSRAAFWRGCEPLFLLSTRHFHNLAPTVGLGNQHGAELPGIAGNRNRAEFAEPPSQKSCCTVPSSQVLRKGKI